MTRYCPQCNTAHQLAPEEIFVACTHCYTYLKLTNDRLEKVSKFIVGKKPLYVCFDPGQTLLIKGVNYIIKGCTQRHDKAHKAINWREYFLQTSMGEEAYLSEYKGKWMLAVPLQTNANLHQEEHIVQRDDTRYTLFQAYDQEVNWASGYFEYDIVDIEKLHTQEFIAPPKMLIRETQSSNNKGTEWYEGEYVASDEIYKSFVALGNTHTFPVEEGVSPVEPYRSKMYFSETMLLAAIASLMVVLIQLFFWVYSPKKTVFEQSFSTADLQLDSLNNYTKTPTPIVSKSFVIDKTAKLEIILQSTVDNSWLESDITMVNNSTRAELPIVIGNEYYHGVESGESWTEGSNITAIDYSSVPAGRYHLLIETATPKSVAGSYTITLKSGGIYWINMVIIIGIIGILPLFLYFKEQNFEYKRWLDSDFAP